MAPVRAEAAWREATAPSVGPDGCWSPCSQHASCLAALTEGVSPAQQSTVPSAEQEEAAQHSTADSLKNTAFNSSYRSSPFDKIKAGGEKIGLH